MRTFAEQLEYDYQHDDIKLAELIVGVDSRDQDMAERVAYAFVNKDWPYLSRWIEHEIAEHVKKLQKRHDDRMLASFDGWDPGR